MHGSKSAAVAAVRCATLQVRQEQGIAADAERVPYGGKGKRELWLRGGAAPARIAAGEGGQSAMIST